ncbi:MAG: nicotinate (nicotinamide) nucleotide adenylyltransferase [Candidatus Aminicenantes bacterium]|nr:nicotinate (nicotinamide) nucleotide adenylyltransferase [Candidatus Aminicenantes bacterium]
MRRLRRIGIFGGTFDPVHFGHLRAAEEVRSRLGLDRILFIPSNTPPHKRRFGMAPAADRLAMVRSALRGRPGLEASDLEVASPRTSYSVFTLAKIRTLYPDARLFFLLGADAFLEIKTWREWRKVLDQCVFIVLTRPGSSLRAARSVLGPGYRDRTASIREAADLDNRLRAGRTILFFRIDALPVSSTEIRRRVRGGRSLEGLVPAGVAARIKSAKLYQE